MGHGQKAPVQDLTPKFQGREPLGAGNSPVGDHNLWGHQELTRRESDAGTTARPDQWRRQEDGCQQGC